MLKESIQKGFSYLNQGNLEQALEHGNYVLDQDRQNVEANILVSLSHFKNKSYLKSLSYLELVVAKKPFDFVLNLYHLESLLKIGDYDKGLNIIKVKEAIFLDERLKLLKINFLEAISDHNAVIKEAYEIVNAKNILIKFESLAWNYELLNKLNQAKKYANLGLSMKSNSYRCNMIKAKVLFRKGKYKKAKKYLKNIEIEGLSATNRSIFYSLEAQVLEKQKKFNKAFEYFTRSNQELKQSAAYQLLREQSYYTSRKIKNIDKYFKSKPKFSNLIPAKENITFMVGLPRSGTTLLENILKAHTEIASIEEKPVVENILQRFLTDDSSIQKLSSMQVGEIKQLQQGYIETRGKYSNPQSEIIIDKLPLNLIHIGILYRIFPNAKFIISLRDIRDVALSCYFQSFQLNDAMANFLCWEKTTEYLMRIINSSFGILESYPINYKVVNYETLINEPFEEVEQILEFLELDWQDGIYQYRQQLQGKNISTPSYAAITKKINNKQKGRWQNYKLQTKNIDINSFYQRIASCFVEKP